MYLEKFIIKNFRGINNVSLTFNKGLNVLIGENNAGKSAIIDALRICLSYGNQRRDIYITKSDFHLDKNAISENADSIEFHLHFHIDVPEEVAWFNDLLSVQEDGTQDLQLHFKFYLDDNERVKYKVWGGTNEGQAIAPEVLYLIYHVHLDALRDAEQFLRPIRGNRLGQLYTNIQIDPDIEKDQEKKSELAKKVRSAVDSDAEWVGHVDKGKEKINEHLKETSFSNKQHQVDISFLPFDFNRLVDNLKIQMPLYSDELLEGDPTKQKYFELYQNGLGYNNLIYTATVLGDLKQRKQKQKETYAALLIEEPESHLHPQLQNLFFNYLNKLDTEHGFQIFISSHSPTITAKASLKSVIVLQNQENKVNALSLQKSGLTEVNHKYLHKFLDVTKSQIFFSNGAILVEGISEALLLPIFSRIVGEREEYDIDKAGVELVNLNGVAFSHFANLFNNDDDSKNLKTKCSLITDDDTAEETDEITSRAKSAKELEKNNLKVFLAERTFEFELFITGNKDILLELFKEMHPVAAGRIVADANIKTHAANFLEKVISNKAKSELAHRLAVKLSTDEVARDAFKVPSYIENAIKFAVKGE
ncbi:MAG: AAA family ATPase [Reichenbachiella sp.]|uniref:ATP-dependent nuclease n=1 Tax=Reichenbachiella sp. TaxID=2184521 RepID=UPI00296615A2|nr:AAA family ATPase [Reichenbachiella sp.]MDW3210872.1 AAA family ATPase [Reichenbachiella sp.]